jgi:magnesium-transporting ATPase (P-type)
MLCYHHSADFEPNPNRESFNQYSKTSTMVHILSTFAILSINFAMVGSHPWKQPYWRNKWITIVFLFNFITATIFLFVPWFSTFGFQTIDPKSAGITYAIILLIGLLIVTYNQLIRNLRLYEK